MGFEKVVELFLQFIGLFKFWEVIDPYERGVVLQLGRFRREIGPGWWLRCPFGIDKVISSNVVFKTIRLPSQTLTTIDGGSLVLTPVVSFKILDIKKFLLEVDTATGALKDSVCGVVGEMIRHSTMKEMMKDEWHTCLRDEVRRLGRKFGISVVKVRLPDFGK
ncbi:MAG: SPFH domain-containing protein, partial [Planctomycetota bacterium]